MGRVLQNSRSLNWRSAQSWRAACNGDLRARAALQSDGSEASGQECGGQHRLCLGQPWQMGSSRRGGGQHVAALICGHGGKARLAAAMHACKRFALIALLRSCLAAVLVVLAQIDSRLLRHDEYRHWWVDRETEGSATQLESLLRPLFEQQRLKQHQQDEQEELQREQQELGRQQQQQQPEQPAAARKRRWW